MAARNCGVARQTLATRLKSLLKNHSIEELKSRFNDSENESDGDSVKPKKSLEFSSKYSVQQVFTNSQEKMIVNYLIECDKLNSGLTYTQVRELAYEFC